MWVTCYIIGQSWSWLLVSCRCDRFGGYFTRRCLTENETDAYESSSVHFVLTRLPQVVYQTFLLQYVLPFNLAWEFQTAAGASSPNVLMKSRLIRKAGREFAEHRAKHFFFFFSAYPNSLRTRWLYFQSETEQSELRLTSGVLSGTKTLGSRY